MFLCIKTTSSFPPTKIILISSDKKDIVKIFKDAINSTLVSFCNVESKMKKSKGIKVQITLPTEIVEKIEVDLKKTYLPRSDWFLKVVEEYFSTQKEPSENKNPRKMIY
jgi:hypothetical protein